MSLVFHVHIYDPSRLVVSEKASISELGKVRGVGSFGKVYCWHELPAECTEINQSLFKLNLVFNFKTKKLSRRAFFDCEKCIPSRAPPPPITPHHIYNTTTKPQRLQRI